MKQEKMTEQIAVHPRVGPCRLPAELHCRRRKRSLRRDFKFWG